MTTPLTWWIITCGLFTAWMVLRAEIQMAEHSAKVWDDPSENLKPMWYTVETLLPVGYMVTASVTWLTWWIG